MRGMHHFKLNCLYGLGRFSGSYYFFSAYDSVTLPLTQGKEERPNTTTGRTGCEARIRLHRTDDHGWYVTVFINKHNHPLSVKCGEKKQWKSHSVISPLAKDFIRNLRENNIRFDQIYNILGSGLGSSLGVPFRK